MLKKIKKIFHDIKCGLHSGFPICCILYFLLVPMNKRIKKLFGKDMDLEVNYIACPLCVFRFNIVEVKSCNCHGFNEWKHEYVKTWKLIGYQYYLENRSPCVCGIKGYHEKLPNRKWKHKYTVAHTIVEESWDGKKLSRAFKAENVNVVTNSLDWTTTNEHV